MIGMLGVPTFFITLSANDKWPDLIKMLRECTGDTSSKDAELVAKYPILAARHFHHRVKVFTQWLKSAKILGRVGDYFWRIEFQMRGSPHVHMLLWINHAVRGLVSQEVWVGGVELRQVGGGGTISQICRLRF